MAGSVVARMKAPAYARETATSWAQARPRLTQVRLAGYKAQATDMGESIVIHITPGKHADLSKLPPVAPATRPPLAKMPARRRR